MRALKVIEAGLYLLFFADIALLIAGIAHQPSYEPVGGVSLIVILLLAAGAHRLRVGREY